MLPSNETIKAQVHYRIGSLENIKVSMKYCQQVHYRIGSLEITAFNA